MPLCAGMISFFMHSSQANGISFYCGHDDISLEYPGISMNIWITTNILEYPSTLRYFKFRMSLWLMLHAKGLNEEILRDRNEWRRLIHVLDLA